MSKCDSYYLQPERHYFVDKYGTPLYENIDVPRCLGTKERDACDCDGDRSRCSFYESVREKAAVKKSNSDIKNVFDEIENMIGKYWGVDPAYYINSKDEQEASAAKLCCKILEVIQLSRRGNQ